MLTPICKSPHVRRDQLVEGDDRFPLILVTENGDECKENGGKKPIIAMVARMKASDVASSYSMDGLLLHLALDNSLEMSKLRKTLYFISVL